MMIKDADLKKGRRNKRYDRGKVEKTKNKKTKRKKLFKKKKKFLRGKKKDNVNLVTN